MKNNKIISLIIILIIYIIAAMIGFIAYINLPFEFYFNLLIADVISTIVVFTFSLILNNASCYDPYWSIAPLFIVVALLMNRPLNLPRILVSIAVIGWAVRLTINWIYTFDNLNWIDWRYELLKDKSKKLYPIINLLGIHMFPTIVVYFCILPVVFMFYYEVSINPLVIVFFIFSIMSFTMQGIADIQMHKYRKNKNGTFNRNGLWKYSRHPNYLGEILMWINIAILAISALGNYYFLIIGAVINTLMFIFISIPLAENHQKDRKEGFLEYKNETRMLLPIYKKKNY